MKIYDYLKEKSGDSYLQLADHRDMTLKEGEEWIPGAYEGIILRSSYGIKQPSLINFYLSRLILSYAKKPSKEKFLKLESKLGKYAAISIADPLVSFLSTGDKEKIREGSLSLIKESTKREVVKVGLALLSLGGKEEDRDLLKLFASHEEFTLYAIITAKTIFEDYNNLILDLGGRLRGWGKIACMYELDYEKEESRYFAVTKGCTNQIGLSYLANVCAIKGNLLEYLKSRKKDMDVYYGACDIFSGLLEMDKNNDTISEYPDAQEAARAFYEWTREIVIENKDDREETILSKLKDFRFI